MATRKVSSPEHVGSASPTLFARLWRGLAALFTCYYTPRRRRYFQTYCKNLADDFHTLDSWGRTVRLDLEQIYIALRISQHDRPDWMPKPDQADVGPQGEDLRRAR